MNDLTITYSTALDLSNIKNPALLTESKALADITNRFNGLVETTAATVESLRREQAPILYRIKATKLYEKDGFKSMSDYCKAIGLSDSSISGLTTAGKVYSDKKAPDALKALSPSKLAQMGALLNDKDMSAAVYEDAKNGVLDGKTLAQVKDYVNDVKGRCGKVKAKVVKTYTATANGESVNASPATIDEWESTIKGIWTNVIKAPDLDGHKVLIGYSAFESSVYFLSEYTAPKAQPKQNTMELLKIVTRKVRRGEELTDKERELAVSVGLIDEDEDEDAPNFIQFDSQLVTMNADDEGD